MSIDFKKIGLDVLQYQYGNTNIAKLIDEKAKIFNKYIGELTLNFQRDILDYNTCVGEALDYIWGAYFKISRVFKDEAGNIFSLSDEQFRYLIKIKAFSTTWDGSIASVNAFLQELYKNRGFVVVIDNQEMTISTFVFGFKLEAWEDWIFKNYDILPRPAGVGTEILIVESKYFAFYGYNDLYDNPLRAGFATYEQDQDGKTLTYDGEL